jgi:CRISPR-associated protein Csb3
MKDDARTFSIQVDVTNPGQFFACCGLFEVAHRLWSGAEGWFAEDQWFVLSSGSEVTASVGQTLIEALRRLQLTSLSHQEREEREALEAEKRELRRQRKSLSKEKEDRRKQLGEQARGGSLHLESRDQANRAFPLLLDWWQREDAAVPKTWAGLQEIHKVARAAQHALSGVQEVASMLDHGCVLRMPVEYRKRGTDGDNSVEPFYFDARRFAHALDAGFSLDAIGAETVAHPAVELLALIGLQRFRPIVTPSREPKVKAIVEYCTWHLPIGAAVAAAAACGAVPVPGCRRYGFKILARDDQKRYGAFGWAGTIGEHS